MNCPKCGEEINPEQVLCVNCGYKLKENKNSWGKGCLIALGVSFIVILLLILAGVLFARKIFFGFSESINLMDAVSNVQSIAESEAKYYAQNNNYATDFYQLSVDIPNSQISGNKADTENFVYEIALPYIKATRKDNSKFKYTFTRNIQTNEVKCEGNENICDFLANGNITVTKEFDGHTTKYEYHSKYEYHFGEKDLSNVKQKEESLSNTEI
ncbi:MAG: zinc-ribbon domain-containing protein [Elusimicrobiaceae bacterium]|nr:zinc-ribbon domain-containing protein [Elusimicrobiaceae bacterium]